jgi:hypothetical protein
LDLPEKAIFRQVTVQSKQPISSTLPEQTPSALLQ